MSLSTKLRADYCELANQYLDHIPIEKPEDFKVVKEALMAITDPSSDHHVPAPLKDRIKAIKEIIDQPEMYVEKEKHYEEFKNLIIERVAKKIKELEYFTNVEKQKYIDEQKELKLKAAENQEVMARSAPPEVGSEAHVLSEAEWLRQQTLLFQQNRGRPSLQVLQSAYMALLVGTIERHREHLNHRIEQVSQAHYVLSLPEMFELQMGMNTLNHLTEMIYSNPFMSTTSSLQNTTRELIYPISDESTNVLIPVRQETNLNPSRQQTLARIQELILMMRDTRP